MSRKTPLTPSQIRQQLRARGVTITAWAQERGYDREAVYRVLNGKDKAHYGRAHEIAVALGLKVPDDSCVGEHQYENAKGSTRAEACNPQRRAAA